MKENEIKFILGEICRRFLHEDILEFVISSKWNKSIEWIVTYIGKLLSFERVLLWYLRVRLVLFSVFFTGLLVVRLHSSGSCSWSKEASTALLYSIEKIHCRHRCERNIIYEIFVGIWIRSIRWNEYNRFKIDEIWGNLSREVSRRND